MFVFEEFLFFVSISILKLNELLFNDDIIMVKFNEREKNAVTANITMSFTSYFAFHQLFQFIKNQLNN